MLSCHSVHRNDSSMLWHVCQHGRTSRSNWKQAAWKCLIFQGQGDATENLLIKINNPYIYKIFFFWEISELGRLDPIKENVNKYDTEENMTHYNWNWTIAPASLSSNETYRPTPSWDVISSFGLAARYLCHEDSDLQGKVLSPFKT